MLMVELLGSLVRSEMNNSRFANNGSKTFSMIFREVAVPAAFVIVRGSGGLEVEQWEPVGPVASPVPDSVLPKICQ